MYSEHDTYRISRLHELYKNKLIESAKLLDIIKDCCNLSSEKITTLTGYDKENMIDFIHSGLVIFAISIGPKRNWKNWEDAWNDYLEHCRNTVKGWNRMPRKD